MDQELLNVLHQIVNRVDKIGQTVDSIDQRVHSIEQRIDIIEQKMDSIEHRMDSMEQWMDSMELKTEEMQRQTNARFDDVDRKIQIIVEIQKNHMEQNEREHREIIKHMDEKASLFEKVMSYWSGEIVDLSEEVVKLKEEKKSVHEVLGRHETEITTLKRKLG